MVTELKVLWPGLIIFHGRARRPSTQKVLSVEMVTSRLV